MIPTDSGPMRVERIEAALLPMAQSALDAGQVQTARRLYTRLLEVDPDSAEARVGIGDVHMADREIRQAATWYRAAIDHARTPAVRHAALLAHARAALTAAETEAARDSFARLTDPAEGAEDPEVAWGWNGVGVLHLLDGNAREAVAAFERAALLDPGETMFHENLARAVRIVQQLPESPAGTSTPDGPLPASSEAPAPSESTAPAIRATAPVDAPFTSDDADPDTPTDGPGTAPPPDEGATELAPRDGAKDAAAIPAGEPRAGSPKTWVGRLARALRISRPAPPADDAEDATAEDTAPMRADGPPEEPAALDPDTLLDDELPQGDVPAPLSGDDPADATAGDPEPVLADDRPDESAAVDPDTVFADADDLGQEHEPDPVAGHDREDAIDDDGASILADELHQDDPPAPSADDAEDATDEDTPSLDADDQLDESTALDPDPLRANEDLPQDDVPTPTTNDDPADATTDDPGAIQAHDQPDEPAEVAPNTLFADDAQDDPGEHMQPVPPTTEDPDIDAADDARAVLADDRPEAPADVDPNLLLEDDAGDDLRQDDPAAPSADDAEDAADEDAASASADGPFDESTGLHPDPVLADDAEDDPSQDGQSVPSAADEPEVDTAADARPVLADDRPEALPADIDPDPLLEDDASDDLRQDDPPAPSADDDAEDAIDDDAEDAIIDDPAPIRAGDPPDGSPDLDPDTLLEDHDPPRDDAPTPLSGDDPANATADEPWPVLADDQPDDLAELAPDTLLADDDPGEDGQSIPALGDDPEVDAAADAGAILAIRRPEGYADVAPDTPPADDPDDALPEDHATDPEPDQLRDDAAWEDVAPAPDDDRLDASLEDMIDLAPPVDDVPPWLPEVGEDAAPQDVDAGSARVDRTDSPSDAPEAPPDDAWPFDPAVPDADDGLPAPRPSRPSAETLPAFVVETDDGRFVQVGAYVAGVRADAAATRLRERTDLPVRIQPADRDGRLFFLVRIGPVPPGGMPEDLADELGIRSDAFAPLTAQALRIVSRGETYLQVGVYADRDAADGIAEQARAETGYPVEVRRLDRDGRRPLYRVRVGPVDAAAD